MTAVRYNLNDLRYLMTRLRDPGDGCPWDLKQDFHSIVPHTLEEAYELADAIELGDLDQIRQEMGDVLFQLVFYSRLAEEQSAFDFDDVVDGITRKLLRRHPHVFPAGTLQSRRSSDAPNESQIKQRWEEIKTEERGKKAQHSALDDIPQALPAASRASKLQKRASQVGFDWESVDGVVEALHDELIELREAMQSGEQTAIEDELGDVLFSLVNLSRHLGLDAEATLRKAGQKFERRFRFVETRAQKGGGVASVPRSQLEDYWREAKKTGL